MLTVFPRRGLFSAASRIRSATRYGQFRYYAESAASNIKNTFNIAVVGSGPSAFYTILYLLQKQDPQYHINIDIYEKLPVPFGLSRYGVAPDHPEVKNCEDKFQEIIEQTSTVNQKAKIESTVNFIGNIEIGKDISLKHLRDNYHVILFSYGCSNDSHLQIKGADLAGVISSRKFVGWYNGLPDLQDLNPPLDKVENVTIIGNGNVALDITRVLLSPAEYWERTDLSRVALESLKKSNVKNVTIVARRGFLQTAFTNSELRELLELSQLGIFLKPVDRTIYEPFAQIKSKISRVHKRRIAMIENYSKKGFPEKLPEGAKTWSLEYLKSPIEVVPDSNGGTLSSVTFRLNKLQEDEITGSTDSAKVVATNATTSLKTDLLITSIGFKGSELETMKDIGINFDTKRGVIPNLNGKIVDNLEDRKVLEGLYVSGWIKSGPKGTIASTMMDSFAVGGEILNDISNIIEQDPPKTGFQAVKKILIDNNVKWTTWEDWKMIDAAEKKLGQEKNKVREKFVHSDEMLQIVNKN